jgi:endonuclease/exonuclease/phosphatase family metal-dependent hydrolase
MKRLLGPTLLAWLALIGGAAAAEPAATPLSVLTYNIHGLPSWIAGDDPPARIPQILAKATRYDLVLLQEDFAHQALVLAHNPFRVLLRGSDAWSRWLQGAGLTTLSDLESVESHREPYGVCAGWLAGANDCLGNKGFLHTRWRLPTGATLDVWNTHLDAGSADADRDARRRQLELLAAAIESRSADRAIVVGGDFNLEWDEPRDRALFDAFASRLGLAVAALTPAGAWNRRLDYLLARGGGGVTLESDAGGKDESFVDAAGVPLSDHPAIRARLRVR